LIPPKRRLSLLIMCGPSVTLPTVTISSTVTEVNTITTTDTVTATEFETSLETQIETDRVTETVTKYGKRGSLYLSSFADTV